MPYKEKAITKLYYSIGEVAEQLNVAKSLIRFWETEFDILRPKKSAKGNRLFTQKDIDNLKLIYHLVKEKGYTLDGARKKLKEQEKPEKIDQQAAIVSKLKEIRKFLETLHNEL